MSHKNWITDINVVISHGPGCFDGAVAAWVIWRNLPIQYRMKIASEGGFYSHNYITKKDKTGNFLHPNTPTGAMSLQRKGYNTVFVFVQPGSSIPETLISNKNVVILDVDLGDNLVSVVEKAKSVILCDHHCSSIKTIERNRDFLLSRSKKFLGLVNTNKDESAATLIWKYIYGKKMNDFIRIIQINDTWLDNGYSGLFTKDVIAFLLVKRSFISFESIEETFLTWDQNVPMYINIGRSLNRYQQAIVSQISTKPRICNMQTTDGNIYKVAYICAPILHSEIGVCIRNYTNFLYNTNVDFCATWKYVAHRGLVAVSLRNPKFGLNLSEIASKIKGTNGKGGGHADAASFSFYRIENFGDYFITPTSKKITTFHNNKNIVINQHLDNNLNQILSLLSIKDPNTKLAISEYQKFLVKQLAKQSVLGFIRTKHFTYKIGYANDPFLNPDVGFCIRNYVEKRYNILIDFCATWTFDANANIVSASFTDLSPSINSTIPQIIKDISSSFMDGPIQKIGNIIHFPDLSNFHKIFLQSCPSDSLSSPPTLPNSLALF